MAYDLVYTSKIQETEDYTTITTAIKGTGKQIEQTDSGASGGNGAVASFARQFVGRPYVWGGNTHSGWDCSGFVAYVYNHFGIPMHQPTTYEEFQGQVVGPPYQEGDMLFWGARGNTYHVALALDSNTMEMAANPEQGTIIQSINSWPPAFGVRNAAMAAKVSGDSSKDNSATDSTNSDADSTNQQAKYTCQGEYDSTMAADDKWGKIWADPFSSDMITDEGTLKQALKKQIHDYPDVQYTTDGITFKDSLSCGIKNDITVGNYGYLRDRYGVDVNVRIQSFTKYLDRSTTHTSSITFGNKIFGINEWDRRESSANVALHKAPRKPETATPAPVTGDDIPTIQVPQKEDHKNEK
ncbi:phage tail protein [Limosilactobacillus secaliphilus]|uniref:NlpC/P60 domain-containing protein n=1 Tax=Limosilactobacillus secaliphilus TaxID=396268 RepID=A0A0R2I0V7_9LACO|nr:phage tail protein [Limosilactobacillus secaliphilus]KRN58783.1 hypothetical protein IV45_GL000408 [Limosilactobacillus secaliphilus]